MRRPYRLVTRALPTDYRREHGDELIDTALALHDGKWSLREGLLLLTHGLRTRAIQATSGSQRLAVRQAVMTTIELIAIGMVVILTVWLTSVEGPFETYETRWWMTPLMVVTAAGLLSGRPRLVVLGVTALTFAAQFGVRWPNGDRYVFAAAVASQAILLAVAGWWALRSTTTKMHPGRSFVLLVVLTSIGAVLGSPSLGRLLAISLGAGVLAGLLLARWDPRLLLIAACSVVWNQALVWPFLVFGSVALGPAVVASQLVLASILAGATILGTRRLRVVI